MTKQKDSFSGLDLRSENGVHISPDSNLGDIDDKNLSEQIRERYSQDTQFRKHLARWVMWIIPIWLFIVIAILVFCGIGLFSLGPEILIALLATTTRFSQYRIKGYFPEPKKINIVHMDTKGSFPYVQNSSDTDSQPPIPADYSPKFDESYLNSLIEKAYPRLKDVDPVQWLDELRRED